MPTAVSIIFRAPDSVRRFAGATYIGFLPIGSFAFHGIGNRACRATAPPRATGAARLQTVHAGANIPHQGESLKPSSRGALRRGDLVAHAKRCERLGEQ